ncbi:MAG: hypothetical protein AB7F59_07975 [Bdellovibrionales bacterium]
MKSLYKLFTLSMLGVVVHFVNVGDSGSISLAQSAPEGQPVVTEDRISAKDLAGSDIPAKPRAATSTTSGPLKGKNGNYIATLEEEKDIDPWTNQEVTKKYLTLKTEAGLPIEGCKDCSRISLPKPINTLAELDRATKDKVTQLISVADEAIEEQKKLEEEKRAQAERCETDNLDKDASCLEKQLAKKNLKPEEKRDLEDRLKEVLSQMMDDPKKSKKAVDLITKLNKLLTTEGKREIGNMMLPKVANQKAVKFSQDHQKIQRTFEDAIMAYRNNDPRAANLMIQAQRQLGEMYTAYGAATNKFAQDFSKMIGTNVFNNSELSNQFSQSTRVIDSNIRILNEITNGFRQNPEVAKYAFNKITQLRWLQSPDDIGSASLIAQSSIFNGLDLDIGGTGTTLNNSSQCSGLYLTRCLQIQNMHRTDGLYTRLLPEVNALFKTTYEQQAAQILGDRGLSNSSLLNNNRSSPLTNVPNTTFGAASTRGGRGVPSAGSSAGQSI